MCEDSASAELSVTEIASAMAEIAYILENLKNSSDIDSPFQELEMGLDGPLDPTTAGAGLPVTLDELKELNRKLKFYLKKNMFFLLQAMILKFIIELKNSHYLELLLAVD